MLGLKTRKNLGIANLIIGFFILILVMTSDGGFSENARMDSVSWIFIWCGILNFFGKRKRWATILSIFFYSFGIIINFCYSFLYVAHYAFVLLLITFLVLICISLANKSSFEK